MILLCGLPTEAPLALVQQALDEIGELSLVLDPRRMDANGLEVEVDQGRVDGRLRVAGSWYPLDACSGVYSRWIDCSMLPEVARGTAVDLQRRRRLQETLLSWMEVTPALVVNRTSAMGSNSSKPFQAQAIRRAGFAIPETLVTNDPEQVAEFAAAHGRVVYKSISGVRSIVQVLEPADAARLQRIRACPVQFQQQVQGEDVRVHTVGGRVFATRIRSGATDYRYAARQSGEAAQLAPFELPPDVAARCVDLASLLRLEFAGIDLRRTSEGIYYCFEVNPSPAFSFYQAQTGQPIAHAVAEHLTRSGREAP